MSASLTVGILWSAVLAFWGIVIMEERSDRREAVRLELDLAANSARLAKLYGKSNENEDVCSRSAS